MTREEAKEYLNTISSKLGTVEILEYYRCDGDEMRKAIETLWQEPFMNKSCCIANQVCHEDKVKVLDKIKSDIEGYKSTIDNAISEDELKIEGMKEAYTDCLEIIDKYIAESEG